jgi:hypothetical protein
MMRKKEVIKRGIEKKKREGKEGEADKKDTEKEKRNGNRKSEGGRE